MKNTFYPDDPSYYLKNELIERLRRRPHYSLRAFARDLSISPSTLSEFMRGRTKVSIARIKEISKKINLSEDHTRHWIDLIHCRYSRTLEEKKSAEVNIQLRRKKSKKYLDLISYNLIAGWESFALLELLGLDKKYNSSDLEQKLDISSDQLNKLIENLNRLNLIRWESDRWLPQDEDTFVGEDIKSEALRKYHKSVLKKAFQAIDAQSLDRRELRSTVFGLRKKDLPKIKAELNEMWVQLISKYTYVDQKDSVYCFSMQLFDLLKDGE